MQLGVLGPVEVRSGGQVLDAGHARRRAVLAVLLLNHGRVVPVEVLIDRVWAENPPASVLGTLYGYVSRLKAILARVSDPQLVLSRRPGGYLLQARAEQLDLCRFRRLAAEAAGSDDNRGAELLRQALGCGAGRPWPGYGAPG
ncbi:MAG: AfsR/SARP family transcriptional regulator [Trebonia sp.]